MKDNVLLTYYKNGDTMQLELTTRGIPQKLFTYIFVRLVYVYSLKVPFSKSLSFHVISTSFTKEQT